MHIVPRDDSTAIAPPNYDPRCPNCGQVATGSGIVQDWSVITAHYICDNEHLWQTKWIEGA